MDERTQGAMLLAVGGVALRLGLTDSALSYVKAGLQPLLTITGIVLVMLGVVAVVRAFRATTSQTTSQATTASGATTDHAFVGEDGRAVAVDDGHGHGAHGPAVAWLLMLPLLALLLIAPPPLGAFAASRQSDRPPVDTRTTYPPLPDPVNGAVELSISEFVFRGLYDEDRSLEGERVRVTGFVSDAETEDGYQLSRFMLNCCAADGTAINMAISDPQGAPPVDTWLTIEGTWQPREGVEPGQPTSEPPILAVEQRTEIPAPAQPYEY